MQPKDKLSKILYAVGLHDGVSAHEELSGSNPQNAPLLSKRQFKLYLSDPQ